MVGEKDLDAEVSADTVVAADSDTTSWAGGMAAPRIPDDRGDAAPPGSQDATDTERMSVATPPIVESKSAEGNAGSAGEAGDARSGEPARDREDLEQVAPRRRALQPMTLERIDPSLGRGEQVRLDVARRRIRVGRAESNELQLYTASTSREHAIIEGSDSGDWVLVPLPGKSVRVDGDETSDPVLLEPGMNIVLGGDHLRCIDDGPVLTDAHELASAERRGTSPWRFEMIGPFRRPLGIAILLLAGVGLLLWLLG
jgi:FHA domain